MSVWGYESWILYDTLLSGGLTDSRLRLLPIRQMVWGNSDAMTIFFEDPFRHGWRLDLDFCG